jgi:hypothetical protein
MQFSLRFLFVAMTVLALGCGFAVLMPVEISHLLIGLIWIVALSVLVVGLFFARGDQRAFCIGAFIVASSAWTDIGGRFMQGVHYGYGIFTLGYGISLPVLLWLDLVVLALTAVANGWLCVQARRYFERQPADELRTGK